MIHGGVVKIMKIENEFGLAGDVEVCGDFLGGFFGNMGGAVDIDVVNRLSGRVEVGRFGSGRSQVTDLAVGGEDVTISFGGGARSETVGLKTEIGAGDGSGEPHFTKDLKRDSGASEARLATEKVVFAGIEAEIEPLGAGLIGFECFGTTVEIQIDVLQNIAHDGNHKYIIAWIKLLAKDFWDHVIPGERISENLADAVYRFATTGEGKLDGISSSPP